MEYGAGSGATTEASTPASTRRRFLARFGAVALLSTGLSLGGRAPEVEAARTRLVRKSGGVDAFCVTPDRGGYCPAVFFVDMKTTRVFKVAFIPDDSLCGPVEVLFRIREGDIIRDIGPVVASPGQSTGFVNAGRISSGAAGVMVHLRYAPASACGSFPAEWSGELKTITSRRRRK